MTKLIEAGLFAKVVKDDGLTEHGLNNGDLVYIVGDGFTPIEGDGYSYRLVFIVTKLVDDHIKPDEDNPGLAVDGTSLEVVDEETFKRLDQIKIKDYGSDEAETIH